MNRSQLKAGAILSYATVFLGTIISLVYTPFMLRLLGQSEYGLYSLSSSIIGYLGVMEFGFGNALIRYTAAYRALDDNDSQCKLYGMFLIIYSVISVAVIIAGTFVVMNSNVFLDKTLSAEELVKANMIMSLMVFNLAISLPFSIFASVISAHERFIFSKTIQLLYTMLSPMIILLLLLMGYRSVGMAMVGTFFTILSIVVNAYYCFNVLKIKFYFKNLDWSIFKEIAAYSFYIFLGIIFDKIFGVQINLF